MSARRSKRSECCEWRQNDATKIRSQARRLIWRPHPASSNTDTRLLYFLHAVPMLTSAIRGFSTSAALLRRAPTLPAKLLSVSASGVPEIFDSGELTDRKSRFVGHAAKVKDLGEVRGFVEGVLEDKRVRRATHPAILAWRVGEESGECIGMSHKFERDFGHWLGTSAGPPPLSVRSG